MEQVELSIRFCNDDTVVSVYEAFPADFVSGRMGRIFLLFRNGILLVVSQEDRKLKLLLYYKFIGNRRVQPVPSRAPEFDSITVRMQIMAI